MSCPHCLDLDCQMGAVCGGSRTTWVLRATGWHKDVKQHSKMKEFESEHMFPTAALKLARPGANSQNEPTMSIAYRVHRGAVAGAGGGVSSTGSSATAKAWSSHLGRLAKENFAAALRLAAIDQANAHRMHDAFTHDVALQIISVIEGHYKLGRINDQEKGNIVNEIADYYYRCAGFN